MEGSPNESNIRNLSEVRRAKKNAEIHRQFDTVDDGSALLRAEEVDMTLDEALADAREVVQTLTERDVIEYLIERQAGDKEKNFFGSIARADIEKDAKAALDRARVSMNTQTVESLTSIFDRNRKQPEYYDVDALYAAAEALLERFPKLSH